MVVFIMNEKQKQILEEKCTLIGIKAKYLPEEIQEALTNDYVDDYRKGRLIYSRDFYKAMDKKIKSGMTYVEAYISLGFNVEALGEDRANSAGKRAKKMAEEGTLYKAHPTDFDGTVSFDKMKEKGLSDEEMLAYLQARCMYLEVALDYEKEKKRSQYQALYSELKRTGKLKQNKG